MHLKELAMNPTMHHARRPALHALLALAVTTLCGAGMAAPTDAPEAPSSTGRTAAPRDTQATSDRTITAEVKARLAAIHGLNAGNIRVTTTDGVVKLEGTVRDDTQRATVMKLARDVRGVTAVSDELRAGTD
jgi:hyperosmotically inducible protein